jgi:hypothetical protein
VGVVHPSVVNVTVGIDSSVSFSTSSESAWEGFYVVSVVSCSSDSSSVFAKLAAAASS